MILKKACSTDLFNNEIMITHVFLTNQIYGDEDFIIYDFQYILSNILERKAE